MKAIIAAVIFFLLYLYQLWQTEGFKQELSDTRIENIGLQKQIDDRRKDLAEVIAAGDEQLKGWIELREYKDKIIADLTEQLTKASIAQIAQLMNPTVYYTFRRDGENYIIEQWTTSPRFASVEVGRFKTKMGAELYRSQLSE